MGKVKDNVLVKGMSGQLDNILLKHYSYGTVVSKMPDRSRVKLTAHQKKLNTKFQEAVAYARTVIRDPSRKKLYEKRARKEKRSVYHLALAEYLKRE